MTQCAKCGGYGHDSDECPRFSDQRYRACKINRRAAYWAA